MSKSLIACAIDSKECAVVRLKTSGENAFSLNGYKTLPFGLGDLASGKGMRLLKKLDNYIKEWPDEELALCIGPKSYLPLPAVFPYNASSEKYQEYCKIEARYFLNNPDEYDCDCTGYGDSKSGQNEKKMLFFYAGEPVRRASEHFAATHRVVFSGTPQLPLLHLSKFTGQAQVILELEHNYLLLTIARDGRIEQCSCRDVKNRKELQSVTIRELVDNPLCRETEIQVIGTLANRSMTRLIQKETSLTVKPLSIPPSIPLNNPEKFSITSAAAVKAISLALMALDKQKESTLFSD
jgi:hypothetical protein